MKEKKDNKRRAEAFLKQEMDKPEKIQDHHLTGTDQPFLPFMEQCGYAVTQPVEENVRQAADFGPIPAARRSEMPGILKSRCGTPPYIAPRS